jgi:hypothetical protein
MMLCSGAPHSYVEKGPALPVSQGFNRVVGWREKVMEREFLHIMLF